MKRFFVVALIILVSAGVFLMIGAADVETGEERIAIENALISAKNVQLALGAFTSETGTTSQLTEEELERQIEAYNTQVNQFYSKDNPCCGEYKEWNESMLREDFAHNVFYRVDGGILDYQIQSIRLDNDSNTASVELTAVIFNNWVAETENRDYRIQCCAATEDLSVVMSKEDGEWKLHHYDECKRNDDSWMPQDVLDSIDVDNADAADDGRYAHLQVDVIDAANAANTSYTRFDEALAAAERINVREICPLSASGKRSALS